MATRALLIFSTVLIARDCEAHRDANLYESDGEAGSRQQIQLAVQSFGGMSSLKATGTASSNATVNSTATSNATVESMSTSNATLDASQEQESEAELSLDQSMDAFHQAVDRLQKALDEQWEHRQEKKKKKHRKLEVHTHKHHEAATHFEHASLQASEIAEASETKDLKKENELLKQKVARANIADRMHLAQDDIDALLAEDEKPNLEKCKIDKAETAEKTVQALEECSRQLMNAVKQTKESNQQSTKANTEYVKKFEHVMTIMSELKDLKALWTAFEKDHNAARNTLVQEAKELEPVIKALGGGTAAANYQKKENIDEEKD